MSDKPFRLGLIGAGRMGRTHLQALAESTRVSYYPGGDMARIEVFGTRDAVRCEFLDPKDGERIQLAALLAQAEAFASFAAGGPATGATAADAAAAMLAAERAWSAIQPLRPAVQVAGADGPSGSVG